MGSQCVFWGAGESGGTADTSGGGDVSILPQDNATAVQAFVQGTIDGAWVPEPWVSEYVKAGAKVLVDEATLWPGGQFVTTNIIVTESASMRIAQSAMNVSTLNQRDSTMVCGAADCPPSDHMKN